jgi:transcriptional regulator with XRE-family HTH domain
VDYHKELGKAIRIVRMQKKLSVQDLHYGTRMSYVTITRIERGTVFVRLDTLLIICQVLQVKPSTLFGMVDEKL